MLEAIGPLRFRGNDITVFHLLDPAELDFSFRDPSAFEDLESGEQIPIVPDALADQYKALVQAHVDALSGAVLGQPHRLHAGEHVDAARSRAVQLPVDARAAVEGRARPMSFLTPLFLVGLAGLAIPVILHLIQKERKNVVQFPSLMFLRRIPYQSVRRRRIRHWLAAVHAAGGAGADRAGVCAAVPPAERDCGGRVGRARSRHPARPVLQHGLRRRMAAGVGQRRSRRSTV